jgi:hypothetical protein
MPVLPSERAAALPTGEQQQLPPSQLRRLRALAAAHPDEVAVVVATASGPERRTWSQVEVTVEQAAAGLLRSGMRADQVVLSLLPAAHAHPELDLALRAIGAVVVHVAPDATPEDLVRELGAVDVRLVLVDDESRLERLVGLQLRAAAMFETRTGWDRLLDLGAERLRMDPDAVTRVDRVVDPDGTAARVLRREVAMRRVAPAAASNAPGTGEVTLLVGHDAEPLVHAVRDAHLVGGGALGRLPDATDIADALAYLRPTTLVVAPDAVDGLRGLVPAPANEPRRLLPRSRTPDVEPLRPWFGGRLVRVVATGLPTEVDELLRGLGIDVVVPPAVEVLPAELPVPPPVLVGDVADLPRRSRQDPGTDFRLRTDVALVGDEPEETAFVLPSLPLFGGESFLDKLLIEQARQAGT